VTAGKPVDADHSVESVDSPRERQHQCKGVLRAGDVGTAAHAQHLDAACRAGRDIDIPKNHSIFVNHLETRRERELLRTDGQGFGDNGLRRFEIIMQSGPGADEPDIAGVKRARRLYHLVTPAAEIRQIGRHEVRERGPPFVTGARIKDHADQASPDVVLHDQYRLAQRH
jgi:hypothetical protein